ncbi:MAG: hypothetical protein K9N10_12885 [Deltaproteobacteria bacterium]|nr:hypothetical protein [Deltaproteobacteria bacterium]
MNPPEIIVNLWYYVDEGCQFIFALAGRAYVAQGGDEEKTALLKQLAETDYPLATRRLVPDNYVCEYAGKSRRGVAHISELENPETQLFECVYQALEEDLAKIANSQNLPAEDFKIPDNPLFVMTALYQDDYGEVHMVGI